jgi:hypothetical protein
MLVTLSRQWRPGIKLSRWVDRNDTARAEDVVSHGDPGALLRPTLGGREISAAKLAQCSFGRF